MRILVTGDRGFVGSATTRSNGNHEVIGYDVMDGHDVRDREHLRQMVAVHEPARILHLAAIARFADADADPYRAHATNVLGTANVVAVAEEFHVPLVYASTGSVYMPVEDEPPITETFQARGNSVYGCTKLLGELYVQRATVPWIILRYAHLYGLEKRMHGLVGGVLSRIERGLAPTLYGGAQSNDFTYIDDVVAANWCAIEASWDKWNQVYNIGSGQELSTEEAFEAICEVFAYDGPTEHVAQRSVDPARFVYDTTKASAMLGFTAVYDFRAGLEAMHAGSSQQPYLAA